MLGWNDNTVEYIAVDIKDGIENISRVTQEKIGGRSTEGPRFKIYLAGSLSTHGP